MSDNNKLSQLWEILEEIDVYQRSLGKLSFDMECCAPPEGIEKAGADMAVLGKQLHKLTNSPEYVELLGALHADPAGLTPVQKNAVDRLYDRWEKQKNFTPEFAYEMDCIANKAYGDWLAAKQTADYAKFKDTFAACIDVTRRAIDLRERKYPSYYTACIDDNERGMTEQQLDDFFAALKNRIVPLMKRIQAEGKPIREDFMSRPCPIPLQEELSRWLLELEGLRKSALVLMTTEHPFTTNFGANDVRVTTHYHEDSFISNVFTTLHEGGHALFMQNEPEEFYANHSSDLMSNGMHETISRFYENIIGRSEEFIQFVAPVLREKTGDIFADVTDRELYEAVNIARPSLIRTESDELTYCLHVMIRYEIEKDFVNGKITVDEVPALWNAKYKEYLGVDVPDDSQGCLQDVHWTMSYGYFPSYALGNAYGVQILRTMQKDFDVFGEVRQGRLDRILRWLKERVFSCASLLTPDEWIRQITGEGLNPDYFLDYLEEKYSRLYELK